MVGCKGEGQQVLNAANAQNCTLKEYIYLPTSWVNFNQTDKKRF